MNFGDHIALLLLLLFGLVVTAGSAMFFMVLVWRRRQRHEIFGRGFRSLFQPADFHIHPFQLSRPPCWLAVRSKNLAAVQSALALHNPHPCSWLEGLSAESARVLFISPPVAGWILVAGSGLPEPDDDVDACHRFVLELSRKLGHVQFFSASRILGHHAWIRVDNGKVLRAYAWAGKTLWNQGRKTQEEIELGLNCFDYNEPINSINHAEPILANVEKVSLLAARWSLDPAMIDQRFFEERQGIAGELSFRPH